MEAIDRIRRLVRSLADELNGWAGELSGIASAETLQARPDLGESARLAVIARSYLRLRRKRDRLFEEGLFADPAWDVMLDLFAAEVEGRPVSVSSACIAAAVPPTTALRWIKSLVESGILSRHLDPADGRRVYVRLEPETRVKIARWLRLVRIVGR